MELALKVRVIRGENLASCDSNGLSDPYVKVLMNKKKAKTRTQRKTLNPEWQEEFEFGKVVAGDELLFECWDWDKLSSDDFMGQAAVLFQVEQMKPSTIPLNLHLVGRGKEKETISGSLSVLLTIEEWNSSTAPVPQRQKMLSRSSRFLSGKLRRSSVSKSTAAEITQTLSRSNPVYGVALSDLMEAQKDTHPDLAIPLFVDLVISWLKKSQLHQQVGIFRVGGVSSQMNALREKIESAPLTENTFEEEEGIHNMTGLLKAFLRELPEPLMTFDMYPVVINPRDPDSVPELDHVLSHLESIPKANIDLLGVILRLASFVSTHHAENRMDAQNLAIVIGPNLLWKQAEEDSMSSLLEYRASLAVITSVVQEMIEKFDSLTLFASTAPSTAPVEETSVPMGRGRKRGTFVSSQAPPPLRSLGELDPKELFSSFDADDSGALDAFEFGIFYKDLVEASGKGRATNKQIMDAIHAVDENGDGEITYDEFAEWWKTKNATNM